MYEHVTKNEALGAADELINLLGVAPDLAPARLYRGLGERSGLEIAQRIAGVLGLPVSVRLRPLGRGDQFTGSYLSPVGEGRKGTPAIAAKVLLPDDIPLFGSVALEGFPIEILVSQEALKFRSTFATLIAHELSHVLLATLRYPHADDELRVDLVPLVLGLRSVVRLGRTVRWQQDGRRTSWIKYGYLTDELFPLVVEHIERVLSTAERLLRETDDLRRELAHRLERASRQHQRARVLIGLLDANPPSNLPSRISRRLVELHNSRTVETLAAGLGSQNERFAEIERLCEGAVRDRTLYPERLRRARDDLSEVKAQLDALEDELLKSLGTLKRGLPMKERLAVFLGLRRSPR